MLLVPGTVLFCYLKSKNNDGTVHHLVPRDSFFISEFSNFFFANSAANAGFFKGLYLGTFCKGFVLNGPAFWYKPFIFSFVAN